MIKGGLSGVDKALKQANQLAKAFEKNRDLAVKEGTLALHREAVLVVSENSGGDTAKRYNPSRNVSVSKPGNPPHTDTGQLRQSIKFDVKEGTGRVGSNLKYAAWLEFGTENMRPRPWLSVAVENVSDKIGDIFNKWMKAAIKDVL